MRLIIYGAGGVGCVVGGHLARAGHDVVLIGRPGHVKAINDNGLRFVTPSGTHVLRISAVTEPNQIDYRADDVVLLCMKGQNTEEALHNLKAVNEDIPIMCFQNGVRNEEIATRYFPRVYGVIEWLYAVYLTDGEVLDAVDPPGWLIVGCYPKGTDELAESVAAKLRSAGFFAKTTPDIMPYKWGKLVFNLANAISAITNAKIADANDDIARAVLEEAQEILPRAGIRWIPIEEVRREWPEINERLRGSIEVKSYGSTWQSLARRQGTVESEFTNGEVVRLANKLGIKAPINETLMHISQEMAANREPPGKYTPAQLCKLLGLNL